MSPIDPSRTFGTIPRLQTDSVPVLSLHSRTNPSTLNARFLANSATSFPYSDRSCRIGAVWRPCTASGSTMPPPARLRRCAAYWTPPMTPRLAFDLERPRIESLSLTPWFPSPITTPPSAMLLRTVPSARQIPVSLESSAPTASSLSTLASILPASADAQKWVAISRTIQPNSREGRLTEILSALNAEPNVS